MKDLKTPFFTILFIFFFLILYTKFFGPIPFSVNSLVTNKQSSFQVTGEGKATAVPDTADVVVGATQQSSTVEDAQNKVNLASQKIINDIKKLGIDEKDIKTDNYSVDPQYDYSKGQTITGYSVTQQIEVKVKPIGKVNQVVDTATADGANIVQGASFTFSDELEQKLEDSARSMAIANAKDKANSLANAAGIHLGKVIDVSEGNGSNPVPVMNQALTMGTAEKSAPTNITPGQSTVDITVTLSYETY